MADAPDFAAAAARKRKRLAPLRRKKRDNDDCAEVTLRDISRARGKVNYFSTKLIRQNDLFSPLK